MAAASPFSPIDLRSSSVDELVAAGARTVRSHGTRIQARAGDAIQACRISYVLMDSTNRVHAFRAPTSVTYLARELLAYFGGSLNVEEGLAQASTHWRSLADVDGRIASNYGFYAFHEPVGALSQFDWVLATLKRNLSSRRAIINFNQPRHKADIDAPDFPCDRRSIATTSRLLVPL